MKTTITAYESLQLLWQNYLMVSKAVDPDMMLAEDAIAHEKANPDRRPFRIMAWSARLSFYLSAWVLWEFHSKALCNRLGQRVKRDKSKPFPDWVAISFTANGLKFGDLEWFVAANCLRNLLVHEGARVTNSRGSRDLERARKAFPNIDTYQDGYIEITHEELVDLKGKIRRFFSAHKLP